MDDDLRYRLDVRWADFLRRNMEHTLESAFSAGWNAALEEAQPGRRAHMKQQREFANQLIENQSTDPIIGSLEKGTLRFAPKDDK